MKLETLSYLHCPECESELETKAQAGEIASGLVNCKGCRNSYPILSGVLVLVPDVESYLLEHVKGISRYVPDEDIPKSVRRAFVQAKRELANEHIEEDLEAERITALYVMNHYLRASEVSSPSPLIDSLIKQHWDHGPFEKIKELIATFGSERRSLVELGCGVGGLYAALQPRLNAYLGLDSSFASIVLARHFALGVSLRTTIHVPHDLLFGAVSREVNIPIPRTMPEHADFIVCDLADPPLKAKRWQTAAALNVIDMLPEPASLPKLQHKLLGTRGVAIQSCPYIWHPEVAKRLRRRVPKETQDSAKAVEWLYRKAGFDVETTEPHLPWLFFKNARQLEIYSVHLFFAVKTTP